MPPSPSAVQPHLESKGEPSLLQGESLDNYFALIKKGNSGSLRSSINAKVGMKDTQPPPSPAHINLTWVPLLLPYDACMR